MILPDYNNHLCPECGHKIGMHTDSIFGHNPLNNIGLECNKTHNSLVIDKLILWWKDALEAAKINHMSKCKLNISRAIGIVNAIDATVNIEMKFLRRKRETKS